MDQARTAKVNVSVKILEFGHLETHEVLGSQTDAPQYVEKSELRYSLPFITAPSEPVIVYPTVAFV